MHGRVCDGHNQTPFYDSPVFFRHVMRGLWVIQKVIGEKMKKLYFILILNVFYIFGFSISSFAEDSKKILKFSFPEASNPLQTNSYYCKDIVGSLIEAVTENMKHLPRLKKGIRGEVFKGTDAFSVKIDKDKLHIKTKLEFEMGDVGGSLPFSIIHNDDDNVVAIANFEVVGQTLYDTIKKLEPNSLR